MLKVVYVAAGGAVGALLRYLATSLASKTNDVPFPIATLLVNAGGCFAMGLLTYGFLSDNIHHPFIKSFFCIGLLGAFTTFSTFSYEAAQLLNAQRFVAASSYIMLSVLCSLIGFYLGAKLAGQPL